MKLYTEEQVKEAYLEGWNDGKHDNIGCIDRVVFSLTPIELPSDEEILKVALEETNNINEQILFNNGAIYICKLIEEQILNQNKNETLEEWKSKFSHHCVIKKNQNK